jgi:hypothetical protein
MMAEHRSERNIRIRFYSLCILVVTVANRRCFFERRPFVWTVSDRGVEAIVKA